MRDIFKMWTETRMVVLTAVIAAIYAATVMPLKIAPIVPGFTEIRPGVALVVFCSFLFGPAAAWGAAFGNLIADFFGTLGLGSIFGFFGNFLFGLIPYKVYRNLTRNTQEIHTGRQWTAVMAATLLASATCGFIIGWGVDLLGFVPFHILAVIIAVNNSVLSGILVPILIKFLYDRTRKWGLHYSAILPENLQTRSRFGLIATGLLIIGSLGGILLGTLSGYGLIHLPFSQSLLLSPFVGCVIAGALLI